MTTTEWITLLASLGALIFSLLNYRRTSRFENSNHIFKIKLDVYARLLGELNNLLDGLGSHIEQAKSCIKRPDESTSEMLEKSAGDVDKIIFEFDNIITINSLVIPKIVLTQLKEFSDYLLAKDLEIDEEDVDVDYLEKLDKLLDKIIVQGNNINEIIRKDLHVEKLNAELYGRLK